MPDILQPKNSLTVFRGESKTLKLTIRDAEGNPKNITGGKVILTVKTAIVDRTPVLVKSTDSASEALITKASAGEAEVYLVPADTKSLSIRDYVFDVWLILAGKQYPVVLPSTFNLQPGVTVL